MCQIQYFEPYPYDLVNIFHPQHTPIGLKARWPKKASQQLGGMESYMFLPMGSLAPRCIRPRPRNTTPCASPSSGRNPGLKKVGKMPWWCLFLAPWWCHEIDKMPWWCLLLAPWWCHEIDKVRCHGGIPEMVSSNFHGTPPCDCFIQGQTCFVGFGTSLNNQ